VIVFRYLFVVLSLALGAFALPLAVAQESQVQVTAAQLFEIADTALAQNDFDTAEAAYRALLEDPDAEIRTEARFRLALLLADKRGQLEGGAIELRRILDDRPDATRVRLELARLLAGVGRTEDAERELRRVQAGALPPDVARFVAFFSDALRSERSYGASIELALAPDSNISRATRSETLGTTLGDFTLDEDAREKSGVGLSFKQQAFWRPRLSDTFALLGRISASEILYRDSDFNDISAAFQLGPEFQFDRKTLSLAGVYSRRWFGGEDLSRSWGATANFASPLNAVTQLRIDGSAFRNDDRRNDSQDGDIYSGGLSLERSFSPTMGGALQVTASRLDAKDPGYATTTIGGGLIGFQDFGRTSFVVSANYAHLEADGRLFLFPKVRIDDRYTLSAGATFRDLTYMGFAPFVRATYERSASTVGLYEYDRVSSEFGATHAF
jgi:outer membrane protein